MARRSLTIRRVDPWSVLKVGFLANLVLLGILLLAGRVVWFFIDRLELITKACDIASSFNLEDCGVNGGNIFRNALLLGLLGVVVQTGIFVFAAFLFNLIAELTGGFTLGVEDDGPVVRTQSATQTSRTQGRTVPVASTAAAEPTSGMAGKVAQAAQKAGAAAVGVASSAADAAKQAAAKAQAAREDAEARRAAEAAAPVADTTPKPTTPTTPTTPNPETPRPSAPSSPPSSSGPSSSPQPSSSGPSSGPPAQQARPTGPEVSGSPQRPQAPRPPQPGQGGTDLFGQRPGNG